MTPVATYRLQLTPSFGFAAAEGVVPYLAQLGISHLYLSPVAEAVPGSEHGYDATDPARLREELGGEAGFGSLAAAAKAAGLGIVLDVVPNHVAAHPANPWWWEVLELGRAAPHARHFDVDWDPPERRLRGQLALGVLGDHYGRVLSAGRMQVVLDGDRLLLRWPGGLLPLNPQALGGVLLGAADRGGHGTTSSTTEVAGPVAQVAFADLAFAGRALAQMQGTGPTIAEDAAAVGRLLARTLADPTVRAAMAAEVEALNADLGRLHDLLEEQHYELMRWQRAADDLSYRRFFDVANLVGLRLEDSAVFDDVLGLPVRLHRDGLVDGFRLDHVDGLADPSAALGRLADQAPSAWILVEKILTGDERLPDAWPVAGTTGYDTMARLTAIQVDPAGHRVLEDRWRDVTGIDGSLEALEIECRRLVLDTSLHAEVARLAGLFVRACEVDLAYRDFTRRELTAALVAAVVATPAYRSYGRPGRPATDRDRAFVDALLARAAEVDPEVDADLWVFVRDVLLFQVGGAGQDLALRFQQLCGPVAAKGDEDTLSYRWTPLAGAAEVGHPLARPSIGPEDFHAWCTHVADRWPLQLTALTTHDTKRSEDVRARLCVLSQRPEVFLALWDDVADRLGPGPDPALGWLLTQVALAAHPISADRLAAYALKAAREAKTVTSWTAPNQPAESALTELARALSQDDAVAAAHDVFAPAFHAQSLAQKVLALTVPGVPDVYQGAELLDLHLVDPDNRAPVDFDARRAALAARSDPKLSVVRALLALRRRHPDAFGAGATAYSPTPAGTEVVAFRRGDDVAVAVHRFSAHPTPELEPPADGPWGAVVDLPGARVWERA